MEKCISKSFLLVTLFLTVAFTPACFTQQPSESKLESVADVEPNNSITLEMDILNYINEHRKTKGLPVLSVEPVIVMESLRHSKNMASKKVAFSHDGFEERIKNISQKIMLRSSAENVAYGKISAKEVVDIWLNSKGHRKNIEGRYTITGIGIAKGTDGTLYFTQIFASK